MKNMIFVTFMTMLLTVTAQAAEFKEPFVGGMYIVDGDIPVESLDEIEKYLPPKNYVNKLIINVLAGSLIDRWSDDQRFNLTYCVSDDFGKRKALVVDAMEEATMDWMSAGNLRFVYDSSQDSNCNENNNDVLFDIRPVDVGYYLARAFFPSTKREKRNLLLDGSSFTLSDTALTGILRHEIGHILGFRHEHISDDNDKCKEDRNFKPLTDYDNKSVMHYPHCGGENNIENLILTETDREGVSLVYN